MTEQESDFRPPSIARIALKYGAFVAVASIILGFFPVSNVWVSFILGLTVIVLGIWFAHNEYKTANDGLMKYGQGLSIGLLLSTVIGVITYLKELVSKLIFPEAYQKQRQQAIDMQTAIWEKQGRSEEEIQQFLEIGKQMEPFTPIFIILGAVFLGLILSLIISAFTQKTVKN